MRQHGEGRNCGHCRGRKRRRTASTPDDRADGMAIDSVGWRSFDHRDRADGVAVDAGWPNPCLRTAGAAPPQPRQTSARTTDPWPVAGGPRSNRRFSKRGKRGGKKKRMAELARRPQAASSAVPLPSSPGARDPAPTCSSPLAENPTNSAAPSGSRPTSMDPASTACVHGPANDATAPDEDRPDIPGDRDSDADNQSIASEVPDSQPLASAPDPLSGPGSALSLSPHVGVAPLADQSMVRRPALEPTMTRPTANPTLPAMPTLGLLETPERGVLHKEPALDADSTQPTTEA